jgi:hypothetical protein
MSEPQKLPESGRKLEGPGAHERLLRLRRRFEAISARAGLNRPNIWRDIALGLLVFAVIVGGYSLFW